MYTPILRNRQSEILALQRLPSNSKASCTPLLDLAAPTKSDDLATVVTYAERNIIRMVKGAKGFAQILVDSSELDPALRLTGNRHPLIEAARAIEKAGCIPIPVTGLHRDAAHMNAALKIRKHNGLGTICFRLDSTDVGTASMSHALLQRLIATHSLAAKDVIVLIDLQSVHGKDTDSLVLQTSRLIAHMNTTKWAGVIVAGYGIPDQLSGSISVREQGYIRRIEQDVYLSIVKTYPIDNLWFGDYATLSPTHIELDWRLISRMMSPKAVYALRDSWFVVRGGPFSSDAKGYGQYHDLASEIVALDEFSGSDYSFGDEYIDERTSTSVSPGSPASWIVACVNHHITLTAEAHLT